MECLYYCNGRKYLKGSDILMNTLFIYCDDYEKE